MVYVLFHICSEVLRVVDSLQLTVNKKVATPADWMVCKHLCDLLLVFMCVFCSQNGGDCMVLPTVSEEDAKRLFPLHRSVDVPSGKGYIRITPQPQ